MAAMLSSTPVTDYMGMGISMFADFFSAIKKVKKQMNECVAG